MGIILTSISINITDINLLGNDIDTQEVVNRIVTTYGIVNLNPLVDYIYLQKPVGNDAINEYESITLIDGGDCTYIPKNGNSWSIPYIDMPIYLINNLVNEILLTP
jgi:hypothetical protein